MSQLEPRFPLTLLRFGQPFFLRDSGSLFDPEPVGGPPTEKPLSLSELALFNIVVPFFTRWSIGLRAAIEPFSRVQLARNDNRAC
jgi:hypothetical protein